MSGKGSSFSQRASLISYCRVFPCSADRRRPTTTTPMHTELHSLTNNESSLHLIVIIMTVSDRMLPERSALTKSFLCSVQLKRSIVWVCVCTCRRRFAHLLHYCCTQGRSQASSGMSSILFSKQLLIYGHLPPFCSVALCMLPEHPPTHTHFLSCWLVMGRGGSVSSFVWEVMWLIFIWSPVPMACIHYEQAGAGCVRYIGLYFFQWVPSVTICQDWNSSYVCICRCISPSCHTHHA